jgi:hypothetical protein
MGVYIEQGSVDGILVKRSTDYTTYLLWSQLNYFYWWIHHSYLLDPPSWDLNDIAPPTDFNISQNLDNHEVLISCNVIQKFPVKLFVEISKQYSMGISVCRAFAIANIYDYVPGKVYNIYYDYFKVFKYLRRDNLRYFVGLRFVEPSSGFHSYGIYDFVDCNK